MAHYKGKLLGIVKPVTGSSGEYIVVSGLGFSEAIGRQISISPHTEETLGLSCVTGANKEREVGILEGIGFSDSLAEDNFKFQWKYFGTLQNSYEDGTLVNTPDLSDYWVSFVPNEGLYWDDNLDTSDLDLKVIFRIDETDFSSLPTTHEHVWKSGNSSNGFSITYTKRADGQPYLYITGASTSVDTYIEINLKNLDLDPGVWYELFASSSKLLIREYGNNTNSFSVTGSITFGYADYYESVGYSFGASPQAGSTGGYALCSVRSIDYYRAGKLDFPVDVNLYPFFLYCHFGTNNEGSAGVPSYGGDPTVGTEWVTFDGNDAYHWGQNTLQEVDDIDIYLVFRLEEDHLDTFDGKYTLWKVGDATDGFEILIYDREFIFCSRNSGTLKTNRFNLYNLSLDTWYEGFFSTSKMTIREEATPANGVTQSGTVDVNATPTAAFYMSLGSDLGGYVYEGGSGSWQDYTEMSCKKFVLYKKGGLTFPTDLDAPDVGPIYRWNWGTDVGGTYSWSGSTYATNTDNVENDGSTNGIYDPDGYYPRPSTGWGLVIEFSLDTFASAQVIWKTGDEVDGAAIGVDASGNIGFFGRSSSSLTSITVAASTYLSTGTKYFIYANESNIKIYDSSISLVAEASGTVTASDSSGTSDNQCIMSAVYGCPITGNSSVWNSLMDGKVYSLEIWEEDDLTFPPSNWYHAESEIGFSDEIDGAVNTAIMYTSEEIGFSDTIGGEIISTQKSTSSTIGFNDDIDTDHITEEDVEAGPHTIGFNDEIGAHRTVRNVGQTSILGLDDTVDGYNSVIRKEVVSTFGLSGEVGGQNQITTTGFSATLGLNDSVNENITQEDGISETFGLDDTVGEISVRNVGFSSQLGLTGDVLGGNPLSPDNEGEIGFSDEIGVDYFPVKGFSATLGLTGESVPVRQYEKGITNTIGFDDSGVAENAGDLLEQIPANATYKFYLTLTGANDSLDDYEITRLKTVQLRMKSGDESSYLGITAMYSEAAETAIDARPNGTLVLEMASFYKGEQTQRSTLMEVDFADVRYDLGSNSQSITINGYSALTYGYDVVFLANATQKKTSQDGRVHYRFARPNFYVRPGYKLVYGLENFVVDEVAFYVGENQFYMDVYFDESTLSGVNDNTIYRQYSVESDSTRQFFVTLTGTPDGVDDYIFSGPSNIEVRLTGGKRSYASATVLYSQEAKNAIEARPNGDILIEVIDGIGASLTEFVTVNFNDVSYSLMPQSNTITLSGYKQINFTSGSSFTPTVVTTHRVNEDGEIFIQSEQPNLDVAPGYTINYDGSSFLAGEVTFLFQRLTQRMTMTDNINVTREMYLSEGFGLTGNVVSNTFYRTNHSESEIGLDDNAHVSINDVENAYHDTCEIGFTAYIGYELNP